MLLLSKSLEDIQDSTIERVIKINITIDHNFLLYISIQNQFSSNFFFHNPNTQAPFYLRDQMWSHHYSIIHNTLKTNVRGWFVILIGGGGGLPRLFVKGWFKKKHIVNNPKINEHTHTHINSSSVFSCNHYFLLHSFVERRCVSEMHITNRKLPVYM